MRHAARFYRRRYWKDSFIFSLSKARVLAFFFFYNNFPLIAFAAGQIESDVLGDGGSPISSVTESVASVSCCLKPSVAPTKHISAPYPVLDWWINEIRTLEAAFGDMRVCIKCQLFCYWLLVDARKDNTKDGRWVVTFPSFTPWILLGGAPGRMLFEWKLFHFNWFNLSHTVGY